MQKNYLSHIHYFLITIIIFCLFMPACTQKKLSREEFDVVVEQDLDLDSVARMEAMLTVTPEKAMLHPDYQVIDDIATPYLPYYRMGPGDVVEIIYHIDYSMIDDFYYLEAQDKVSIHFPFHPQFSNTAIVRPDGKLTVPIIGDIYVESMTPKELSDLLNEQYSKYINKPNITVSLEEYNIKIVELKRAITTAPRGQAKTTIIAPDGRLSFPIIGTMQAAGLTVPQLEEKVNEKYKKIVKNLDATIILDEISHANFLVLGEVQNPGSYQMRKRYNLFEALAEAGGFPKTANTEEIVVFRNDGLERPMAIKVNLASMYQQNRLHKVILRPGDIIYVPKTRIGNFNDWVAQVFTEGIYGILPFEANIAGSYSLGGKAPK